MHHVKGFVICVGFVMVSSIHNTKLLSLWGGGMIHVLGKDTGEMRKQWIRLSCYLKECISFTFNQTRSVNYIINGP